MTAFGFTADLRRAGPRDADSGFRLVMVLAGGPSLPWTGMRRSVRVSIVVVLQEWIAEAIAADPGRHRFALLHSIEAATRHMTGYVHPAVVVGIGVR